MWVELEVVLRQPVEIVIFHVANTLHRERLQNCPKVQSGDFDLDGLCSDLQKKAKCSGTGAVVDETDFKKVMSKYLGDTDECDLLATPRSESALQIPFIGFANLLYVLCILVVFHPSLVWFQAYQNVRGANELD